MRLYFVRHILVHIRRHQWLVAAFVGVAIGLFFWFLEREEDEPEPEILVGRSWAAIQESDTLRVASTMDNANLVVHKNHWVGHDFELTSTMVRNLGLQIDFLLADSLSGLFESLKKGEVDVLLLSARYPAGIPEWTRVAASHDSVQWIVLNSAVDLSAKIDSVNRYCPYFPVQERSDSIRNIARKARMRIVKEDGSLSLYDDIFKKYSKSIGWDWRLLAAVAYCESHFNNDCVSERGARGLMQLMPSTAAIYGCSEEGLVNPDSCIKAGCALIGYIESHLKSKIAKAKEQEEQPTDVSLVQIVTENDLLFMTLASYNAGMGHIYDAIEMAEFLGYDPAVWNDNVEHCLRLKSDTLYCDLPGVRCGKFNSSTTRNYVHKVLETYEDFQIMDKRR